METMQQRAEILMLLTMNDRDVHNKIMSIRLNLMRKRAKGTYDAKKAPKIWAYAAESGAKNEGRRTGQRWHTLFPAECRRMVAEVLAEQFEHEAIAGEWDDLLKGGQ